MKRNYIFVVGLVILAAAAIVAQSLMSGPIKADHELSNRVQDAETTIDSFASHHNKLPTSLSEIDGDHTGITYELVSGYTYKLCATFQTSSRTKYDRPNVTTSDYTDPSKHDKGYQCFTREVNLPKDLKSSIDSLKR